MISDIWKFLKDTIGSYAFYVNSVIAFLTIYIFNRYETFVVKILQLHTTTQRNALMYLVFLALVLVIMGIKSFIDHQKVSIRKNNNKKA